MRPFCRTWCGLCGLLLVSCSGEILGTRSLEGSDQRRPPALMSPTMDPATEPEMPAPLVWLPARIRRLSNHELDNSVFELLSTATKTPISTDVSSDQRQAGFTMNAAQTIDATFFGQLWTLFEATATRAAASMPCPSGTEPRSCAATVVDSIGPKAFRRALRDDERAGLLAVYDVAARPSAQAGYTGTHQEGLSAVIQAILHSASFLYLTELGPQSAAETGLVELSPNEVASQIAFLVSAAPPDDTLRDAAAQGLLSTPEQRMAQARRLMSRPQAVQQQVRFVKEWLALDHLPPGTNRPAPAPFVFPELISSINQETEAFVGEIARQGGSLSSLLTSDFTYINGTLAQFYNIHTSTPDQFSRVDLSQSPRRGILSLANFLSSHATEHDSSPVKRGKLLLDQVLCISIRLPSDGNLLQQAMALPRDPNATTREYFEQHSRNPTCAGCHTYLDPLGFAFENFDASGHHRTQENGRNVNTTGTLVNTDIDGPFGSGRELVVKLASSPQVQKCFAKNFFRFASAQSAEALEEQYGDVWKAMPAAERSQLSTLILGYVGSDLFVKRRNQ